MTTRPIPTDFEGWRSLKFAVRCTLTVTEIEIWHWSLSYAVRRAALRPCAQTPTMPAAGGMHHSCPVRTPRACARLPSQPRPERYAPALSRCRFRGRSVLCVPPVCRQLGVLGQIEEAADVHVFVAAAPAYPHVAGVGFAAPGCPVPDACPRRESSALRVEASPPKEGAGLSALPLNHFDSFALPPICPPPEGQGGADAGLLCGSCLCPVQA